MGMFTLCESLYLSFRCKHIHHFNTSHSSAHNGTTNSLKSHSASIQPSMDMDTSAKTINTQIDIKVAELAELEEIIVREVYHRHNRWLIASLAKLARAAACICFEDGLVDLNT